MNNHWNDNYYENEARYSDDYDDVSVEGSNGVAESNTEDTDDNNQETRRDTCTKTLKQNMTRKETKNVSRLRIAFVLIMICTAVAISAVIYFIAANSEQNSFENEFSAAATKLKQSFEGIPKRVSSVSAISTGATIQVMAIEEQLRKESINPEDLPSEALAGIGFWPFVTLGAFQQRATTSRLLSGLLSISFNPIVSEKHRATWERFSVREEEKNWIQEGITYQNEIGLGSLEFNPPPLDLVFMTNATSKPIFYYTSEMKDEKVIDESDGPFIPKWQTSPVLMKTEINENLFRAFNGDDSNVIQKSIMKQLAEFGLIHLTPYGYINSTNPTTAMYATLRSFVESSPQPYKGEPMSQFYTPVYNHFDKDGNRSVVAIMSSVMHWKQYFRKILPTGTPPIQVVLNDTCFGQYTYIVHGPVADPVGIGAIRDPRYKNLEILANFINFSLVTDGTVQGLPLDLEGCFQLIHFFPTQEFYESYHTSTPILITSCVAVVFTFSILLFIMYDWLVERRQMIVLDKAAHSAAIVSSLFPKQVREQLLEESKEKERIMEQNKNRLHKFLAEEGNNSVAPSRPIAELFPQCTVMFADLAGFTAWSSTRDPPQVFILLQHLYHGFDQIAKRRKVYKIETIGDCYVAVTGLPEAQPKHASIMARFAWECMAKMYEITCDLESQLGPECLELKLRVGLHSGPVTGGVLRGDRARFQLFGDTVNTASRMESTGAAGKVHLSSATADALKESGKESWFVRREDLVEAKGKGSMQTYWLRVTEGRSSETASTTKNSDCCTGGIIFEKSVSNIDEKPADFVGWMVNLLQGYLRDIVTKRGSTNNSATLNFVPEPGQICLDDFVEILPMLELDPNINTVNPKKDLTQETLEDLREFVSLIASLYRGNPFHNFEHACHVAASADRLLKQAIAQEKEMFQQQAGRDVEQGDANNLRDVLGFGSDPLASFAIVFSALIHDVDHRGIPNAQLIKEEQSLGFAYRYTSVAEQNSFDISWNVLLSPRFNSLRNILFGNLEELLRFRKFVAVSVLATDIMDQKINASRKDRWDHVFDPENVDNNNRGRKATVAIEHIMQVSDIAHTMQHWQVYIKWNQRLFRELYMAYDCGHSLTNPSTFWYQAELGFFDNYVIPLAKRLQQCSIFGANCDEYLNYAVTNREAWVKRGEIEISSYLEELRFEI